MEVLTDMRSLKSERSESTLADADWSIGTMSIGTRGNWTGSSFQVLSAGCDATPGSRSVFISVPEAGPTSIARVFVSHENLSATYSPQTQGPIQTIDYSQCAMLEFAGLISGGPGTTFVMTGSWVVRGGEYYIHEVGLSNSTSWETVEFTGLTADDFNMIDLNNQVTGIDTTQHPDFSECGGTIEFGFYCSATNPPGSGPLSSYFAGSRIDDWSLTVVKGEAPWLSLGGGGTFTYTGSLDLDPVLTMTGPLTPNSTLNLKLEGGVPSGTVMITSKLAPLTPVVVFPGCSVGTLWTSRIPPHPARKYVQSGHSRRLRDAECSLESVATNGPAAGCSNHVPGPLLRTDAGGLRPVECRDGHHPMTINRP